MDTAVGHEADALAFFESLAREPYRHDFYQALRRLECLFADKPRWGSGLRPVDEPVRLGQEPDLAFAPSPLASFEADGDAPPRLRVHVFGLLGPNGPLPLHFTEYARERQRHASDPTLGRFLDIFHHRFLAFLYRAWAQAQPHVNRDRPADDRFATYVGALIGMAPATLRNRDSVQDLAKWFHAGALVRHVRNRDGLAAILGHYFQVPVRIEEFVGHWLHLDRREQTALARDGASLGSGAALGSRVWDRQCKFRIHLGPLTLAQYESFLPRSPAAPGGDPDAGGAQLRTLVDWVRLYVSSLEWDARLWLQGHEVPRLTLGRSGRLGWTTWLGRRRAGTDAGDLCLDAETFVNRIGARAA